VQLLHNGSVIATVSSDANGRFRFDGLLAGEYTIQPLVPTGQSITPASTTITLGAGNPTASVELTVTEAGGDRAENFRALILSGGHSNNNPGVLAEFQSRWPDITFDSMFANSQTPTLSYLTTFNVVLLYEDGLFSNAPNVGNALAEYVQNGGNVVIGTFYWQDRSDNPTFSTAGWGQLESLDPYLATAGGSEYNSDNLDASSLVAHALTSGVSSLFVDSYHGGVVAKSDAVVVASWSDGVPLIAYRTESGGQRLVGVSTFPGYVNFEGFSGDFFVVWEDALRWAAAGSTPSAPAGLRSGPASNATPVSVPTHEPARGGSQGR